MLSNDGSKALAHPLAQHRSELGKSRTLYNNQNCRLRLFSQAQL